MDRHVSWLRRRIVTSVAKQTAATFAVVALVLFVLLSVVTGAGLFGRIFASVVVAQLVALGRLALSMRSNPLNYSFMKKSVEEPFAHQVSRFQGVEAAHALASKLPGFAPVATIRHAEGKSGPVFDVYHDPSRLVAASVSRSGALSLLSSLEGGRLLVTSAAALPPHERRVMNVAPEDSVDGIIAAHRVALSKQGDVVKLDESAHQAVLDSLALEYASYAQLGPALSSFLDLDGVGRSWRVTAHVDADELADLPELLGSASSDAHATVVSESPVDLDELPDVTRITYSATQQDTPQSVQIVETDSGESIVIPEVIAPQISEAGVAPAEPALLETPAVVAPEAVAPEVETPEVETPEAVAPEVETPEVETPEVETPEVETPEVETPEVETPEVVAAEVETPPTATPVVAEVGSTEAVVVVPAASTLVTVEPDTLDDSDLGEPITAEVPAVVFTDGPLSTDASTEDADALAAADATVTETDQQENDDDVPTDAGFAALPAALGGSVDKATLTARQAPVNSPQLVNRVLSSLRGLGSKERADDVAADDVAADDEVDSTDRPGTLAEAIVAAPDTAVELTGETVVAAAVPAGSTAIPESSEPLPVAEHGVPDLLASNSRRPKLSAVIKATQPETSKAHARRRKR